MSISSASKLEILVYRAKKRKARSQFAYTHMYNSLYTLHFVCRCREENGIALIATVNNQRREIVVEGVIPKEEAREKVKVLTIHQLGDYVKNKQTLSTRWLNDVLCEVY